jgi:hypothetical protein
MKLEQKEKKVRSEKIRKAKEERSEEGKAWN